MADFSRLPYFDSERDVNAGVAFISEDVVTAPFDDGGYPPRGLHLHWALPDALARSFDTRHKQDSMLHFPAVPNLWLVTRVVGDGPQDEKSWLVESDYFYPTGDGQTSGSICFPISQKDLAAGEPPSRYMGRVLNEENWDQLDQPSAAAAASSSLSSEAPGSRIARPTILAAGIGGGHLPSPKGRKTDISRPFIRGSVGPLPYHRSPSDGWTTCKYGERLPKAINAQCDPGGKPVLR